MVASTIHSDFGAQKNKVSHCFHCFTRVFIINRRSSAVYVSSWTLAHLLSWQPNTGTLTIRLAIDPDEMAQNYLISSKPKKRTCETDIWCKNLVFCSLVFSLFSSLHPYSNHNINQHRKQCGPWQLLLLILSDEYIPDLGITRAACVVHCTFFRICIVSTLQLCTELWGYPTK